MARIEKINIAGTSYIENEVGEIIEKECRGKCGEMKVIGEFRIDRSKLAGKYSKCKVCEKEYAQSLSGKKSKIKYEQSPKGREANLKYEQTHKASLRSRSGANRRRARLLGLVDTWTLEQSEQLYSSRCLLTYTAVSTTADHFIAMETGHGGSYAANLYPLDVAVNSSKNATNPYEWINRRDDIEQERFYTVIVPYVADGHGLSEEQLKRFTYYCYDNKRTIDEVIADNRPSLQIWAEETGEELSDKAWALIEEHRRNLEARDFEKIRYYIDKSSKLQDQRAAA